MKFLNHSPLKGQKLQFMGGEMGLSLCQTPTGIGNDGSSPVIMSLVDESPQSRPASISVQFKRLHKIGVGKSGCHGAQAFQVIKRLLAPVISGDGHPLLTCILARHQFMQGLGHLCKLGDELTIISCKPKKTLDFSNSGQGGPAFDSIYFSLICHYSLGRNNVPYICKLPAE